MSSMLHVHFLEEKDLFRMNLSQRVEETGNEKLSIKRGKKESSVCLRREMYILEKKFNFL